jgi:lipopolysaccharide transport system permease protein
MASLESITESGGDCPVPRQGGETAIVYTAAGIRRNGASGWRVMVGDLISSRRLIWLLICRDISVRYRHSFLGYGWAVIPQVATVAIFAFLHSWHVLPMGQTRLPYVIFALWGISVWQLFAGCLAACTSSLAGAGSLVTKINFPRESLVIAAIGQPIFDFLVRLLPIAAVFVWYGVVPSSKALFLPLLLCPVVLLALGLGFIASIANLAVKDVGNALGMALTFGMFLTPVLYPAPVRWPFVLINYLNPVSPLLTATHDLIAAAALEHPWTCAVACLFSVIVFFVGWRTFRATILRASAYA